MPLTEGQETFIQGSAAAPYRIYMKGGVVVCTCISWKNCKAAAVNLKFCKHTVQVMGQKPPYGAPATNGGVVAPASATASKAPALAAKAPSGAGAPVSSREETEEEMLAAVFGKPAPKTSIEMLNAKEREMEAGFQSTVQAMKDNNVSVDAAYKQSLIDRAAAEGRSLRQDEKAKLNGPGLLLAHQFEDFPDLDPKDWWWSIKLDGCRGYWDGAQFVSRQGNVFQAPAWFKAGLPNHPLDGELWMGRQMFQKTMSIVRSFDAGDQWKQIKYVIFDAPHLGLPFEERMKYLEDWHAKTNPAFALVHKHERVRDKKHVAELLAQYTALGDEGLMIRKPGSLYEKRRSNTLLKVKPWKDAEAVVMGYEPGKGRHKGVVGSLTVKMPNGKIFSLGTGLSDAERKNPPPVGSTVTYSFTEWTEDGIPKCAAFVRVRPRE
jgi:DNA ligase-1